jgi:hypothetical protein
MIGTGRVCGLENATADRLDFVIAIQLSYERNFIA